MDTTYSNVYAPPDFKRSFLYAVCIPVCSVGLIDIAVERSSSPAHGSGSPVCARRAHWESIYASITLAAAMSNHNTWLVVMSRLVIVSADYKLNHIY